MPSHLRKSYKPKTSDEAAVCIQSMYRSHRSRQEDIAEIREREKVKEMNVATLNQEISQSLIPKIDVLETQVRGLEDQLGERSSVAAKLGAEVKRLQSDEIPLRNAKIEHHEKIVQAAKRQLEIRSGQSSGNDYDEDEKTSTLTSTEAKIDKAMSILSSACESMRLEDHKQKVQESTRRERGWAGGGHGCPRMENNEGDSRRPCDVPYIFPNLEPASIRRKKKSEKMWNSIEHELRGGNQKQKTMKSTMTLTKTMSKYRDGSDFLSSGLGLRKSDFVPKTKELQSTLPISTRGSAKQVILRVRESLKSAESK